MSIIAVSTSDFKFYYDIVRELKQRDIPFISLSPTDPVPPNVDIIITTEREKDGIDFENVVAISDDTDDIRKGVRKALSHTSGKVSYQKMVIGIDPGTSPGISLVGDGKVLESTYAESPEEVKNIVMGYIEGYEFDELIVRIGHGDRTNRNRTINALQGLPIRMEIVNEEDTTHLGETPDLEAAKEIAYSDGELIYGEYQVEATEGEKKEMQRRSRIESDGDLTISKDLAKKVVEGDIELGEAINKQKDKTKDEKEKEG